MFVVNDRPQLALEGLVGHKHWWEKPAWHVWDRRRKF